MTRLAYLQGLASGVVVVILAIALPWWHWSVRLLVAFAVVGVLVVLPAVVSWWWAMWVVILSVPAVLSIAVPSWSWRRRLVVPLLVSLIVAAAVSWLRYRAG